MLKETKKEHYNLYYIFKEDSEQKRLSKNKAAFLWRKIIKVLSMSRGGEAEKI